MSDEELAKYVYLQLDKPDVPVKWVAELLARFHAKLDAEAAQ